MYNPITIIVIIGYVISLSIHTITLIYIVLHHKNYATILNSILSFIVIFNSGIVYSSFFILSIIIYISESVNILLWKLSLVSAFVTLGIIIIICSYLIEYRKLFIFPLLCYTTFLGFLIGFLFFMDSIHIIYYSSDSPPYLITDTSNINFTFNFLTGSLTIIFIILILIYLLYIGFILFINSREKKILIGFFISILIFIISMTFYILYIIFQLTILRELHIIVLWVNMIVICFIIIKRPEMFLVLTNKIYSLNIYHKSGILLYSYKFEKEVIMTDSATWGSILIGINHILSEFIDARDKIDMLQMKNAKIIVNYDNEYGYAILVITNQKNEILGKIMKNFMNDFKERYKNELLEIQDLNKIINVSEFKDTKEIIEKDFRIYL